MTRSRPLAALAAALALAACNNAKSAAPGVRLRQPSAVAAFVGRTLNDPTGLRPYLAVANAPRNDLSILDAVDDTVVPAPVKLRGLLLPVDDRPSLLASASLGDGKSDLLVAVSGGDSVLQVVETWNAANTVHSSPTAETPPLAVSLKDENQTPLDVLALAAIPSDPGTARLAAALSGSRVAIVEYARAADGEGIALVSSTVSAPLAFQPEAIAALPDDPDVAGIQTALYVATRDAIAPGVFGVAEISTDLATVRALGARAPTRLVAAARLQERKADSAASDASAFDAQPRVARVYAVLDESGCGPTKPIPCGVVALDPGAASGTQALPPDYAGRMPYRAPMRVAGRPLALAVSAPPSRPPPNVEGEPIDWSALNAQFPGVFMRLYMNKIARATTGVAAVASDNGNVYFLDLGRFETATSSPVVTRSTGVTAPRANYVTTKEGTPAVSVERRLWVQIPSTPPAAGTFPASDADAVKYVSGTPGFTQDENWEVRYQGILPDLGTRAAEAGEFVAPSTIPPEPSRPWLALQQGQGAAGARIFNEVARLWDPTLGVAAGDVVVIKAGAIPAPPAPAAACVGTVPLETKQGTPESEIQREFEVEVGSLLAPTADYPGGAVALVERSSTVNKPEWSTCYQALLAAVTGSNLVTGLTATVRAGGLVLTGTSAGYAGRPVLGQTFTLGYPTDPAQSEDTLAAACPLDGWTGTLPAPACDVACRTACDALLVARKARRIHNVSVDCGTDASDTAACEATWPPATYAFPVVNGPALVFQADVQEKVSRAVSSPVPELRQEPLHLSTSSGVAPAIARGASTSPYGASGATAFDRSAWATDPVAGYRFLVAFPADFVLDSTPSQSGAPSIVIR